MTREAPHLSDEQIEAKLQEMKNLFQDTDSCCILNTAIAFLARAIVQYSAENDMPPYLCMMLLSQHLKINIDTEIQAAESTTKH